MIDDEAPPLPVKQDTKVKRNSMSKEDTPPPLPNRNSLVMDDVSLPQKPKPFRER